MKGQFEKYVNTIRKSAWYYAKVWNVDYEEVEAQGYLIYCEALQSYDETKSCKFNTYLTSRLRTLNDFCMTYCRQKGLLAEDFSSDSFKESVINNVPDYKHNWSLAEILENASDYLSNQAYSLLEWILNRDWEKYTNQYKPSVRLMSEAFNCKRSLIEKLLSEIKIFYHSPVFNS